MMKRIIALYMAALFCCLILFGCGNNPSSDSKTDEEYIDRDGFALNTTISIRIYGSDNEEILTHCMMMCDEYDDLLSRTKEGSEIYQLNKNGEADVSDETLELIKEGLYYSELSGGKFDITIEPISSLWDFTSGENVLPESKSIEDNLKFVDYRKVKIDGNHVSMKKGMGIDLGAIAKGYIADQIKAYLLEQGIEHAIINLGGNVLCLGGKPSGDDFGIGIRDPRKEGSLKLVISASDKSVVTSGDYERYIEVDGVRYCHILNPETGYSYNNDIASVSIISDKSVEGDGLSTTCFSLGMEEGLALINSIDNVWAAFIDQSGKVFYSDGLEENFTIQQ